MFALVHFGDFQIIPTYPELLFSLTFRQCSPNHLKLLQRYNEPQQTKKSEHHDITNPTVVVFQVRIIHVNANSDSNHRDNKIKLVSVLLPIPLPTRREDSQEHLNNRQDCEDGFVALPAPNLSGSLGAEGDV